ncbi:hypothetical protein TGAM01_v201263 [Trichoderma gamsii]|uniref:Uncharacterized protein n=1 Tax=Trichoderma gamsii TaxID=398673 RepID=A0A0W7VPX9_9HYPO|nr:hypothetical protein TGAM01_v201263 [Trichoderma gamsii]PNP37814.1 hypothetical protein TGAMA5MH_10299 [Trichoderma gamsii]PON29897.1 hypothetical protein TGAM01_v201263 [Trichoderma gamsii]
MAQQINPQAALLAPTPAPASRPPLSRLSSSPGPSPQPKSGIVVFSGGSATNSLVDVFEGVRAANAAATLSYVIPISDNGGSTSEIIRVFGGPGIGDVRSRLVRLIPNDGKPETTAIKHLFNHRLPTIYASARAEWFEIVEGTHPLWTNISSPKRELIRSFFNSFNLEVVKRMRPSSRFDFSGSSIGNLFLTGARLFTGSFEAAIYLLSSICAVPDRVAVLPALNTNFAHHIAAGLTDGTVITGQNDISHPSAPTAAVPLPNPSTGVNTGVATPALSTNHDLDEHDTIEDANLPGSLPALRRPAITFSKEDEEDLPSRIARIWYINPYGQEIRIPANPRVLEAIRSASTVIYSIGSLFTSLIPNLILKGVGEAIASPHIRNKILLLNGTTDRETGPSSNPFSGLDFVAAIANACADSRGLSRPGTDEYAQYVTHVIYIEGPKSPAVDKRVFAQLGIDTMRLYGPKDGQGKGGRYDAKALAQTLESIVGRKDMRSDRSRRNTLVG